MQKWASQVENLFGPTGSFIIGATAGLHSSWSAKEIVRLCIFNPPHHQLQVCSPCIISKPHGCGECSSCKKKQPKPHLVQCNQINEKSNKNSKIMHFLATKKLFIFFVRTFIAQLFFFGTDGSGVYCGFFCTTNPQRKSCFQEVSF